MTRKFKTVDYEAALEETVRLREALPANHLARFVVDIVAELDLAHIYERYGLRGGEADAPELLLTLLFYGYATGVFSSRKIEKATYETLPFRFVVVVCTRITTRWRTSARRFGSRSRICSSRCRYWPRRPGYLKLGNISMDGSKVHANASKSKAVSYKRLLELEGRLRAEVDQLFRLAEQADGHEVPAGLNVTDEIVLRQERLARLAQAKKVLQARAQERQAAEQAEYEAKQRDGSQSPAHRPQAAVAVADTAVVRTARQGPIQLYRSGVTHHEKLP